MLMLGRPVYRLDRCHVALILTCVLVFTLIVSEYIIKNSRIASPANTNYSSELSTILDTDLKPNVDGVTLVQYEKSAPILWVKASLADFLIGGVPRSGTMLMRVMVDAHPDIHCGEETRVVPAILEQTTKAIMNPVESARLYEAGVELPLIWSAVASYILTIIGHGELAPLLCNSDPLTFTNLPEILDMFPESKFILMIRDGRAVTHSIISQGITIKGFSTKTYDRALADWNTFITVMLGHCQKVGHDKCLSVYYERLVLDPKTQMERILNFIGLPWDDAVLHQEKNVGQEGRASISDKEPSTDQVNKAINQDALNEWQTYIPAQILSQVNKYAPKLENLGYRTDKIPMDYSTDLDPVLE